jgi:hypothetical protein
MNNPVHLLQCRVRLHDGALSDHGSHTWEESLQIYDQTPWTQELVAMEALLSANKECAHPRMYLRNGQNDSLVILPQENETITIKYGYTENKKILGLFPTSKTRTFSVEGRKRGQLNELFRRFASESHQSVLTYLNQKH